MPGVNPRQPDRSGRPAFAVRFPEPEADAVSGGTALPRILYIAGLPRSGSTMLGYVLGGIADAIFVGELQDFWRRFANDELCSCGVPLPGCPFWSVVVQKAFGQVTREQARELYSLERAVFGREWPLALVPLQWPASKSQRISVMLAARERLYRAIGEVANATWVVDSGKEPIYGGVVARMRGANFSTIHIVRDPRGVAFSWHHVTWADMPPAPSVETLALRWVRQNLIIQFLLRRLGNGYVRVRYEGLAQRPADIARMIAEAISAPVRHGSPPAAAALVEGEHHWVAGNPGVRRRLGEGLVLNLDEQWRAGMPRKERWLVTATCSVLMAAYGYGLRSRSVSARVDESSTRG